MLTKTLGLLAAFFLLVSPATSLGQNDESDMSETLAALTEALELTDEQIPQVAAALEEFAVALDQATAEADAEEPDVQKMVGDIKKARAGFQKSMEKALTQEQNQKFQTMVDQTIQEMFEDIAEIKIMDLEPVLDLSEEQMAALVPVMGTGIRELVATVWEYADKKLNMPTKIKVGKKLKGIQSSMNKGISEILTPEQMEKYNAYKEAQKS